MARRRLVIAPSALIDLSEAKTWLLQAGSGAPARKRYRELFRAVRELPHHPVRYPRWPDDPRLRVIQVSGYRVIYAGAPEAAEELAANDIVVLAVLGPGEA